VRHVGPLLVVGERAGVQLVVEFAKGRRRRRPE
jgi:hypothetical protein